MSITDEIERLFALFRNMAVQFLDAHKQGARAEMQLKMLGELVDMLAVLSKTSLGDAAKAEMDRILQALQRDPYETLRVAEYLRTRIATIQRAIALLDEPVQFTSVSASFTGHDRRLPSEEETLYSLFTKRAEYIVQILSFSAKECAGIPLAIPSAHALLDNTLPASAHGKGNAALDATTLPIPVLGGLLDGSLNGAIHFPVRPFSTHRGKTDFLSEAIQLVNTSLGAELNDQLTQLNKNSQYGIYDPVLLQSVTASLYHAIINARESFLELIAIAQAPVSKFNILRRN